MAASELLLGTLRTITETKLDDLEQQLCTFEKKKSKILQTIVKAKGAQEKIWVLFRGIDSLPSKTKAKRLIQDLYEDCKKLLDEAEYDSSASRDRLGNCESRLKSILEIQSTRFTYGSLYGKLVTEWLDDTSHESIRGGEGDIPLEEPDRSEMHRQQREWEAYVFSPLARNQNEIRSYLQGLFEATQQSRDALKIMRDGIGVFENGLKDAKHFEERTVRWCVEGLLGSDLLTEEKRNALEGFRKNPSVMKELADVLNVRMASIDKWTWPKKGVVAYQRRNPHGKYRMFHDEEILDALLLRYVGVKWSVHFYHALKKLSLETSWQDETNLLPKHVNAQMKYFLSEPNSAGSVDGMRTAIFRKDYFLAQLQQKEDEVPRRYEDDDNHEIADFTVKEPQSDLKQKILRLLSADIIMDTSIHGGLTVATSDFKSFGPSLAHTTLLMVMQYFGVSENWISFVQRALEVPIKFTQDGPVRIRKRGTSLSSPLADVLGEVLMYCMDVAVLQKTKGLKLYRLHDDMWFWGPKSSCTIAWDTIMDFADLMGLEINYNKTGSQDVTKGCPQFDPDLRGLSLSTLPPGQIRWGCLLLDRNGRFIIDDALVDVKVEKLRVQLSGCKSILAWVNVYNTFVVRHLTSVFGKPANGFGGHDNIYMALNTFRRIEATLFQNEKPHLSLGGGSAAGYLRAAMEKRFKVKNIPAGFLFSPNEFGGLGLRRPAVFMKEVRDAILENPEELMNNFFLEEQKAYDKAKVTFANDQGATQKKVMHLNGTLDGFIDLEEYKRYREQISVKLCKVFMTLVGQAELKRFERERAGAPHHHWHTSRLYETPIVQAYRAEMASKFGSLQIVDPDQMPVKMVNTVRAKRIKW